MIYVYHKVSKYHPDPTAARFGLVIRGKYPFIVFDTQRSPESKSLIQDTRPTIFLKPQNIPLSKTPTCNMA